LLFFSAWFLFLIPSISAQELFPETEQTDDLTIINQTEVDTIDPLRAAEQQLRFGESAAPSPMDSGVNVWTIVRMVLVLILAAAAVYGIVFLFKRASKRAPNSDPYLKILANAHLGSNRYAHIVSVGSRAWLVGSGENGVNLISEIEDPDIINSMLLDESQRTAETRQGRFPDFAALLRRAGVSAKFKQPGADEIRKRRERLKGL